VERGFAGEVAEFYARFRRGYPAAAIEAVLDAFGVSAAEVVLDVGCGTGQLALPIAGRVRAVVAMDPEPDMLGAARRSAVAAGVTNIAWMLGADTDVPGVGALLGRRSLAAVTIGQALHWMRHEDLFSTLLPLLRPGGGIAVISNGIPLWLQDSDWSRRLRGFLEGRLGRRLTAACGTDSAARRTYRTALLAAGFIEVHETTVAYSAELDFDHLIGGLYSAMSADQLPDPADRPDFADSLRRVLGPDQRFTEHVPVTALLAHAPWHSTQARTDPRNPRDPSGRSSSS
jgi:SAM-dependent methyltransferase